MLESEIIEIDEYRKAVIRLATLNYHLTAIDGEIVLEAARMANWGPNFPLTNLILLLSGSKSDEEPAIEVASDFIRLLRRERLLEHQVSVVADCIFSGLFAGRENRRQIFDRFREKVRTKLFLDAIGFSTFDNLLQSWAATHLL